MSKKPVLNIDDVEFETYRHGESYQGQSGHMGNVVGSEKIGCRLMVVPLGKRGYPYYHNHKANEEMFYIIEGTGKYRFRDNEYDLKKGDLVSAPAGGNETAHQIVNNSDFPLKYIAVSTMLTPDVIEYPETGKIGIVAGKPREERIPWISLYIPLKEQGVDYWYGED